MKISNIDKDFVDIINYLDEMGFCPFSSCDGVLENHTDKDSVNFAYIAFLKSPKIVNLMSAFRRDREIFSITFTNNTHSAPYLLYDNLIHGNTYNVSFYNKKGEMTSYLEKIIKGVATNSIVIPDDEAEPIAKIEHLLEDEDEKSELSFDIVLNSQYQPYMNKTGMTNILRIQTKDGYGYSQDIDQLTHLLSDKFNIVQKSDSITENFDDEAEFIVSSHSYNEIYFADNHLDRILDIIKYSREICHTLPTFEMREPDSDITPDDDWLSFDE